MESRDELLSELQKIEVWEKDQSDLWFWERLGRLPFKVLDKITPCCDEKIFEHRCKF